MSSLAAKLNPPPKPKPELGLPKLELGAPNTATGAPKPGVGAPKPNPELGAPKPNPELGAAKFVFAADVEKRFGANQLPRDSCCIGAGWPSKNPGGCKPDPEGAPNSELGGPTAGAAANSLASFGSFQGMALLVVLFGEAALNGIFAAFCGTALIENAPGAVAVGLAVSLTGANSELADCAIGLA